MSPARRKLIEAARALAEAVALLAEDDAPDVAPALPERSARQSRRRKAPRRIIPPAPEREPTDVDRARVRAAARRQGILVGP